MCDDVAHLCRIGSRGTHPFLGATHLAGGNHFHCPGDLLSIFNTLDLGANFFAAGHRLVLGALVSRGLPAAVFLEVLQCSMHLFRHLIGIRLIPI